MKTDTIKLFITDNCPDCSATRAALAAANIDYIVAGNLSTREGMTAMCDAVRNADQALDPKQIRSAPVMVAGSTVRTGIDCVFAIEENEL